VRSGEVWEWRYRIHGKLRQQMFSVAEFPTEKKLRQHLAASIAQLNGEQEEPLPIIATIGDLIARFRTECLPGLARSTRGTYESTFAAQIVPRWADKPIADLKPMAVDAWLKSLTVSAATKSKARRLLKQLLDKAMFWEIVPVGLNPMKLVRVKGSSKRKKQIVLLTPEQVMDLIDALDEPYSIIIMISAHLGLRIEETGALQWDDFDFVVKTVEIKRAWTHGEVKETKTPASEAKLPIPEELADALISYHESATSKWLFPASRGDNPRWAGIMMEDHIQPVAKMLGLPHIGYHTFRHSYRSWIGSGDATLSEQKDLMRHSSIDMTMSYGGTPVEEMRPLVNAVAARLRR
jgi:integrase